MLAGSLPEVPVGKHCKTPRECPFMARCWEVTPKHRAAARLADPLPSVRRHVEHQDFGGSFSLKVVLPVLVPGSGYEGLEIKDGATASIELERL